MALKAAVEKVIVEHARQGLPIVELSPEQLRAESTRLQAE